jgi:phage head maturation protease
MEVSDRPWSDLTAADYTPEQWHRACLIHLHDGEPTSKDQCKLPVREPDGTVNRNGVHAAASVLAGGRGGVDAPESAIVSAKTAVRRLYEEMDEEPPESIRGQGDGVPEGWFLRSYALDDIRVAATPDGRTVEAYAAVFSTPAEVVDKDGHYLEIIDPKAFNRAIHRAPFPPMVIYNHGLDLWGRPASGAATVPIGEALEVKTDPRGVFTRARYHSGAFADEVLQAVKDQVITAQSFRGSFTRSRPTLRPGRTVKPNDDGTLRTVVREEVFPLVEFGPTPMAVYKDAAILAVRSEALDRLRALISTPAEEGSLDVVEEAVTEALGEEAGHSAPSRLHLHYQRIRAQARRKGFL